MTAAFKMYSLFTICLLNQKRKSLCKACTTSDFLSRSTSKKRHCALKSKYWKFTGGHRFMYFHLSVLFHMKARHINHQAAAAALSCNRVHKGENLRKRSSVMPVQETSEQDLRVCVHGKRWESFGVEWSIRYGTGRAPVRREKKNTEPDSCHLISH